MKTPENTSPDAETHNSKNIDTNAVVHATVNDGFEEVRELTSFQEAVHNLKKNRAAVAGLIIIVIFLGVGIFAPVLSPGNPNAQVIADRKLPPFSSGYILGTDDFGRDMLSRLMYGARISMVIGVVSVGIAMSFGILIGVTSGYIGGVYDKIVMRLIDIMLAFPYILLTIVIVAVLGPNLVNAMVAIGITQIPRYARLVRASVLAEKENDYVTAERSLGASSVSLMFVSILPNCLAPVMVQATLGVGEAILSSAALSFLGLGAQPPTPEWGLMIASSREFITNAWWIVTFPGLATLFAVLGFNLFGDGLRDILDPKLRD
jgi:ABC-type dipeptide/oligopeptide/nickel transport system permease subunit